MRLRIRYCTFPDESRAIQIDTVTTKFDQFTKEMLAIAEQTEAKVNGIEKGNPKSR